VEDYAFLFTDTALIMCCVSMAIVFFVLPLPPYKGLKKYRISLRLLAGAYLVMAVLKSVVMMWNVAVVNLISIETLAIASLQAPLFAFSLVVLINPRFITKRYLCKHLLPTLVFTVLYILVALRCGSPKIFDFIGLKAMALHPSMLVREIFLAYYVFQLIFLSRLFQVQAKKYEDRLDNYFADHLRLYLPGLRYSFYAALLVGVCTLLSCFMFTGIMILIFNVTYTVFYLAFGIYYIQYPHKFENIHQVIYPAPIMAEELPRSNKRFDWEELKSRIIADRYYIVPGINIEQMAQRLKVGRTTLSNFINNEEKMKFNAWIGLLRVEDAKRLLVEYPQCSVAEIAEQVGYSELSNFSRQFKLITSLSPSAWRQEQLKKSDLL